MKKENMNRFGILWPGRENSKLLFTFVDRLYPFRAAVVENFDGLRVFGRVPGLEGDVVQGPEVGGQPQIQLTLNPTRVAFHSPEEFLDVFHLNIGAKI